MQAGVSVFHDLMPLNHNFAAAVNPCSQCPGGGGYGGPLVIALLVKIPPPADQVRHQANLKQMHVVTDAYLSILIPLLDNNFLTFGTNVGDSVKQHSTEGVLYSTVPHQSSTATVGL
jgi:hypothetical protein